MTDELMGQLVVSVPVGAKGAFTGTITGQVREGFLVKDLKGGTEWVRSDAELAVPLYWFIAHLKDKKK
jgi:hypothetical protein